ncbi:alkaline phosphatase family protein [bacterium]|nr:alkaline phosphatase family protein [bacterium]
MKFLRYLLYLACLLPNLAAANPLQGKTVVLALDGFPWWVLSEPEWQAEMPKLSQFKAQFIQHGGLALPLTPPEPPKTATSFASILTGVDLEKTGVENLKDELALRFDQLKVEPFWIDLVKSGKKVVLLGGTHLAPSSAIEKKLIEQDAKGKLLIVNPYPAKPGMPETDPRNQLKLFVYPDTRHNRDELNNLVAALQLYDFAIPQYHAGAFGPSAIAGGDGAAEDRLLERFSNDLKNWEKLTIRALAQQEYDLIFSYHPMLDRIGHLWGKAVRYKQNPILTEKFTKALRLLDQSLGQILDTTEKVDHWVVISDHGLHGRALKTQPLAHPDSRGIAMFDSKLVDHHLASRSIQSKDLRAIIERAVRGFDTLVFSQGETIYQFFLKQLQPLARELMQRPLVLKSPITKSFYFALADQATTHAMNVSKIETNQFKDAILYFNRPSTTVIYADGKQQEIHVGDHQNRALVRFALFDAQQGIRLKFSTLSNAQQPREMLFLSYDLNNLRQYTLGSDLKLWDKTYPEHCMLTKATDPAAVSKFLLTSSIVGFDAKSFYELSNAQQDLVLDTIGISLAETFKAYQFGLERYGEASGWNILSLTVLAPYFSGGGQIVIPVGQNLSTSSADCDYFHDDFHSRYPIRVKLEELISHYTATKHPKLFTKLTREQRVNLFRTFLKEPDLKLRDEISVQDLEYFAAILTTEQRQINEYIQELLQQAKHSPSAKQRYFSYGAGAPLQPYY